MKNKCCNCLGIDLGGTKIQAGVVDCNAGVVARGRVKTRGIEGSSAVVGRVIEVARSAVEQAGMLMSDIKAVGIGAPGPVDHRTGRVVRAPNLGWRDFPLAQTIEDALGLRVVIDNDVNVGTWGEYKMGAARGFDDCVGVFVGTGIGAGFVINGQLFRGHFLTAGEIGHTTIHADAHLGRRTLENTASRVAIANLLAQLARSGHETVLTEIAEGDIGAIRSKTIAKAFAMNDPLTIGVVNKAAYYIGVAIANVVTLMSLPCVVVGGGLVTAMGGVFVDEIRRAFNANVFPSELQSCQIVGSTLGDDAGIIGAALLVSG